MLSASESYSYVMLIHKLQYILFLGLTHLIGEVFSFAFLGSVRKFERQSTEMFVQVRKFQQLNALSRSFRPKLYSTSRSRLLSSLDETQAFQSEMIKLKNGQSGKLLSKNKGWLTLELNGRAVKVRSSDVVKNGGVEVESIKVILHLDRLFSHANDSLSIFKFRTPLIL